MPRTLLVTNDFPPRPGGIQSYLQAFASQLPPDELVVYAPRWRGDSHVKFDARQPFEVVRHPTTLMLPTPAVARRATRLMSDRACENVWFGAAAPLALLAPVLRRAGARRVLASTHGHEVGWSMVPAGRQALRRIGDHTDAVTYVSRYTRGRFASAFGPGAGLEHLPSGVDTEVFRPDPAARAELRARYGLGDRPTVLCLSRLVPRKGQDMLIRALPEVRRRIDGAVLVIVGGGPYQDRLRDLVRAVGVDDHVVITGGVPAAELPAHHTIADVFAMPCRTRGAGLDVEGLGIVYLEASATGVPVVAGRSGGAPETVRAGETGVVVDGTSVAAVAGAVADVLADRDRAAAMGAAGRAWVGAEWRWDVLGAKLRRLLA
ncbi:MULTISPECIES: glycosyltransferase family 4 protein [Rhodococcus]|jgi:phosphatidylinositol alpha-1,6-mannosyltransferase|uniref:phosphatidyl-myo-inositol dimannoside synthase n=2 Tax=Rhodococcus TaxID=1827 RepID=A0A059MPM4_9NOCA|nr:MULTISPECIES: glycosyltransferase family 4 protein [Rhodococcus]ETT25909.1 glycosyl transferase group 1 [Rhodococcus rhodochrous ATCC 21198]NCL74885.1 GDP-mannose-dependent alpha-(1-6)-phosphatidylinositol monomannoside mannosyltransferase [Rhodococcus sp. YH1]AKE90414.1 GDP-mannose-dependent alpha-(1-6)-phosphatidylinositol monomannoside mannosyltransferase [Rhodococcus aetherivorans]ANZ24856.1 alpha-(1-2)-phosphatidylinositol mannosyltransferase [Rhodococcus sp. WB1]KDE12836.1 GDP-mannose